MPKWFLLSWLLALLTAPVEQPIVRDHRGPGAAAQWKIAAPQVDSLNLHNLYNTERQKHLSTNSSGNLQWIDASPGSGKVIFENCTRAGEVIYGSDRVAVRFGQKFLIYAAGAAGVDWTGDRERGCEFRLIPSQAGFVAAGSGDGKFGLYNIPANRYLVYKPQLLPVGGLLGLRWNETESGKPPGGTSARADFVPVDLFFTMGTVGDRKIQTVYLTIRNIGNVASSGSQREMKVTIRGQEKEFRVLTPLAPGATLRNPLALSSFLAHCERVPVELDTNRGLKFQVGKGAFPNDDVFANDKMVLVARDTRPPEVGRGRGAVIDCGPERVAK